MRSRLPIATYLFILRKHLRLMAGTVAVVLAAGWVYAGRQVPEYEAYTEVDIQPRAGVKAGGQGAGFLDQTFISNQIYRIRNDVRLAEKVLDHLRGGGGGEGPEEGSPGDGAGGDPPGGGEPLEPPLPSPETFATLRPRDLLGMVSVKTIPPTSYYQVTARGADPDLGVAVANGYARVFADVFQEEQEARARGALKEHSRRLELRKGGLEALNTRVAEFKKSHPRVDFSAAARESSVQAAAALRASLSAERTRLLALRREREVVDETLAAMGLSIREEPGRGFALHPPMGKDVGEDPLLSERVQGLDVVSASEGVRKQREIIESLGSEIRRLTLGGPGLSETTPEIQRLRRQEEGARGDLARAAEAALLKQALELVRSEGTVEDWGAQLKELEDADAAEAVARAEMERLEKSAEGIRAEIDALNQLVLDAERTRKTAREEEGSVRIHAFAAPGSARLVAPRLGVIYATTIVLALLLAAGLAYLLEFLDDTVKTREDFDRLVRLPFLGYVPHIKAESEEDRDLVVFRGKTGSPEVEAFRSIRTGIQFCRTDRPVKTLLVTSAAPGEGKTTVSINVAAAFTGGKGRVLLIDADLRRARAHGALGVDNSRGLTNVLVGDLTLDQAVQGTPVPGLDFLCSGPIPPNPAEILGSDRMEALLAEAAGKYERVVIDSPPIVAVTDPALLAKFVDAVFLVVSLGRTSVRTLERAQETLATVGVQIHGAMINHADVKSSAYYGSYGSYDSYAEYGYGYTKQS